MMELWWIVIVSAIHLAKNLAFSLRTKHIEESESFVSINEEKVHFYKIHTEENAVDMFIKPLPTTKFKYYSNMIHLLRC